MTGNYRRKLDRMMQTAVQTGNLHPGRVCAVDVLHDGWCALLAGKGPCNCNPVVKAPKLLKRDAESLDDHEGDS